MERWSLRIFLKGSVHTLTDPDELNNFLSRWSGVMNVHFSLARIFLDRFSGFRTHVVATTVCTTVSVHTLICRAHIFLRTAHSLRTSHIFMRVTYTHGSSVCKTVFAHVSYLSISLFSLLMIHPSSLLFPHGHIETNPDYDFTDSDIHMILPYFPVLKAQDVRHSAPASRSLASWPDQMQTQVMSPRSSTRSLLWTMTRYSSTIRTTQFLRLLENHEREY